MGYKKQPFSPSEMPAPGVRTKLHRHQSCKADRRPDPPPHPDRFTGNEERRKQLFETVKSYRKLRKPSSQNCEQTSHKTRHIAKTFETPTPHVGSRFTRWSQRLGCRFSSTAKSAAWPIKTDIRQIPFAPPFPEVQSGAKIVLCAKSGANLSYHKISIFFCTLLLFILEIDSSTNIIQ
jgi:hypothetical protein